MPMNIIELFGHDVSNTCKEMIQRYREHANKLPHEYRLAKKFNFNDGMQALANVQTLLDLQGVMCAFFLRDYITKVANKTIQLGVGYKLKGKQQDIEAEQVENITMVDYDATNETRYAWDNAPSNAGNITQYDASDITQEVIMLAYTKMFSEKMFDNPANVIYSLFFRISNAVQKMMNQLKRETQVRTKNGMYVQEAKSTIEDALWLVDELGFIGEEATVLKLALQDYAKKEINQIIGKRTDRTFKRLEKAFQALA